MVVAARALTRRGLVMYMVGGRGGVEGSLLEVASAWEEVDGNWSTSQQASEYLYLPYLLFDIP